MSSLKHSIIFLILYLLNLLYLMPYTIHHHLDAGLEPKIKSKDEKFIQKFEESHKQNNIDKKIKDLKEIFNQIDKSTENQMISQE